MYSKVDIASHRYPPPHTPHTPIHKISLARSQAGSGVRKAARSTQQTGGATSVDRSQAPSVKCVSMVARLSGIQKQVRGRSSRRMRGGARTTTAIANLRLPSLARISVVPKRKVLLRSPKPTRLTTRARAQVLSFYRSVIRTARAKDTDLRDQILRHARQELDKRRGIEKRNVLLIEHYLRKGKKQLEVLQDSSVQGIGTFTRSG